MIELQEELSYLEGVRDNLKVKLDNIVVDVKEDIEKMKMLLKIEYSDEIFDEMILLMNRVKEIENVSIYR